MLSLGSCYQQARKVLKEGLSNQPHATPDLDARLLIEAACQIDSHKVFSEQDRSITPEERKRIDQFIGQRMSGVPTARILGEKAFFGLDFLIDEHTLIPRPETEELVENVLVWINERGLKDRPLRLVDIGTGSGAILIALLSKLPNAWGLAVDISEHALNVACKNAWRHSVAARFQPLVSDYGNSITGVFDVIVSNPPYIALGERDNLMSEVRDHDPERALFAGADGLDGYRALLPWCADSLAVDGICIVEHGYQQREQIQDIARKSGFSHAESVNDMANLPRFIRMWRKLT